MHQEQAVALLVLLKPLLQRADAGPPAIPAPTVAVVRPSEAKIKWKTREWSDSTVEYGPTARYGATQRKRSRVRTHRFVLRGLAPGSVYHYRVSSREGGGDVTVSRDFYFTTPATAIARGATATPAAGTDGIRASRPHPRPAGRRVVGSHDPASGAPASPGRPARTMGPG